MSKIYKDIRKKCSNKDLNWYTNDDSRLVLKEKSDSIETFDICGITKEYFKPDYFQNIFDPCYSEKKCETDMLNGGIYDGKYNELCDNSGDKCKTNKEKLYDVMKKMNQDKVIAGRSVSEILKRFDKKIKDPRSFNEGKKIVKIIRSYLEINCQLSKLDNKLLNFAQKNNLKKNIFKELKSIHNFKKLNQEIKFITNFRRDIEYYTGIVFEINCGKKEIASGGRYDDLLKSLGAKKNIPAVGAAINLSNI